MNEKELAAELQANKDDLNEWGEPDTNGKAGAQGKRRLQAMVSVRFAPDELERIQRRAQESGQTVSGYLRSLAVRDADREGAYVPTFGVSISSGGTYTAHMGTPILLEDGRRLATTLG